MQLPGTLASKILQLSTSIDRRELASAAKGLSDAYRAERGSPRVVSLAEQVAYLLVRMPATYAAIHHALSRAAEAIGHWSPTSLLDLGAGPGTALWAAHAIFPSIQAAEAVDRGSGLSELGRSLASELPLPVGWNLSGFSSWQSSRKYDLVIASYALGEISSTDRQRLVSSAWESSSGALVIVEPGTRRGFGIVAEIRDQLIATGANIAAPCPHALPCPMRSRGDWCHFSERVERTAQHRQLKQAELGFEDEKFSYLVATRVPAKPAMARIVRCPMRLAGHVKLQLCTSSGLNQQTVTRSQKELYRAVKRADWGSSWEG